MDIRAITFAGSAATFEQLPQDERPEIAFVGRSNVGKSSLLNLLAARRNLARTSAVPGKTRTFNTYLVNDAVYFQDLPGLGYAKVSQVMREEWLRQIARYLRQRRPLRAVVHCIDSRHPPAKVDQQVLQLVRPRPVESIVALTKVDKLSKNARQKSLRTMRDVLFECGVMAPIALCSTTARLGRNELLGHIGAALAGSRAQ